MNAEVRALVDTFITDLAGLMQGAIDDALSTSAAGGRRSKKKAKKKAGRAGAAKKKQAKKAKRKAAKRGKKKAGGKRRKRSAEELEKLQKDLLKAIKRKSGLRMEELAERMGLPTAELVLPAKKLLEERAVKTKGQTRATAYFAR